MLLTLVLVLAMAVCALAAIRARQLLSSVLWLAAVSVLVSILLYALAAPEIAVIELSVGAGLVTVLFVFAIGIAGEITRDLATLVPRWLGLALSIAAMLLLGRLIWPGSQNVMIPVTVGAPGTSYAATLWETRSVDMVVAIALVFAGVLGMLNLLLPIGESTHESGLPTDAADGLHLDSLPAQVGPPTNGHQPEPTTPLREVQP